MATKLYFHDAAPADDPGETERSSVLPAHSDNNDLGIAVKSMDTVIGSSQVGVNGGSISTLNVQDNFFTSFSSPALAAQTITAQTWTVAVEVSEGNAAANSFIVCSLYVFRPSSTSVIGFIYDNDTPIGSEWPAAATQGVVTTFGGSEVTAAADDILVFEFWRHGEQGMAMVYTQSLDYDGGTDVTQGTGVTDAASFIETPQDINFAVTRRIFNIS